MINRQNITSLPCPQPRKHKEKKKVLSSKDFFDKEKFEDLRETEFMVNMTAKLTKRFKIENQETQVKYKKKSKRIKKEQ